MKILHWFAPLVMELIDRHFFLFEHPFNIHSPTNEQTVCSHTNIFFSVHLIFTVYFPFISDQPNHRPLSFSCICTQISVVATNMLRCSGGKSVGQFNCFLISLLISSFYALSHHTFTWVSFASNGVVFDVWPDVQQISPIYGLRTYICNEMIYLYEIKTL